MPTVAQDIDNTQPPETGLVVRPARSVRTIIVVVAALCFAVAGVGIRTLIQRTALHPVAALVFVSIFVAAGAILIWLYRTIGRYWAAIGSDGIDFHTRDKLIHIDYQELTAIRCSVLLTKRFLLTEILTPNWRKTASVRIVLAPRRNFGEGFTFMRVYDEPDPYRYRIRLFPPVLVPGNRRLAAEITEALNTYAPRICRPIDERRVWVRLP